MIHYLVRGGLPSDCRVLAPPLRITAYIVQNDTYPQKHLVKLKVWVSKWHSVAEGYRYLKQDMTQISFQLKMQPDHKIQIQMHVQIQILHRSNGDPIEIQQKSNRDPIQIP